MIRRIIDEIRNSYDFPSVAEVAAENGVDPEKLDLACGIRYHNDESVYTDSYILRSVYPMSAAEAERILNLAYIVLDKDL